jgi:hypothetical protein
MLLRSWLLLLRHILRLKRLSGSSFSRLLLFSPLLLLLLLFALLLLLQVLQVPHCARAGLLEVPVRLPTGFCCRLL